jgi:ribulose-5-phosphate 4-epimerase/fuculose-1-phosphate aldolase
MCGLFVYPDVKARVSESDWGARAELAAFYRSVARHGMTDLTNNHITLKVPGSVDQFLINPFGRIQVDVLASGAKISPVSRAAADAVSSIYEKYRATPAVGQMEWAAKLCWLDLHDPSYRE